MAEKKLVLAKLPAASTTFRREAEFAAPGGRVELTFEYSAEGSWVRGGLSFEGVSAFRHRGESRCTPWHIEAAYDTLLEVTGSEWILELERASTVKDGVPRKELRHFMIYVDSAGSYEVAARAWSWMAAVRSS